MSDAGMTELTAACRKQIIADMRRRRKPDLDNIKRDIIDARAAELRGDLIKWGVSAYEIRRVLAMWRRRWQSDHEVTEAAGWRHFEEMAAWELDQATLADEDAD